MKNYSRCCLNCGSFQILESLLCRPCEQKLQQFKNLQPEIPQNKSWALKTLYRWNPGQSDLLSTLVLNLKGPHQEGAWHIYAAEFAKGIMPQLKKNRRIIVVPAPPRRNLAKDHATFWAHGLADHLGAYYFPCLEKVSESSQKKGSRGERALIELRANVNFSVTETLSPEDLWVFADDVVTTGATARAAFRALGSPPHFEVWALAQRSLSCGASRDLL